MEKLNNVHTFNGIYEAFLKRPIDLIISFAALVILSPLILCTAAAVQIKLGSPIMFTQERAGKIDAKSGKEKIFKLYKFRTMSNAKDDEGNLLSDELRLTSFGKRLRSSSLDELPEFINIVKGDMSIVGPRPLLIEYLPLYNSEQHRRHEVRPGLTSLSASKKRNLASWKEKFKDDVQYVDNITFIGDLKIVFDTVGIVFRREGIHSFTSETMEPFRGNDDQ